MRTTARQGLDDLDSGRYSAAVTKLRSVVESAPDDDPLLLDAGIGYCAALAHVDDEACLAEFEALVARCDVPGSNYEPVVSALLARDKVGTAGKLVGFGLEQEQGEGPVNTQLARIQRRSAELEAEANMDPEVRKQMKDLQDLPYTGKN